MQCLVLLHASLGMPEMVGHGDIWTISGLVLEIGASIVVIFVQFLAEQWGVILALQALDTVHVGVDNLDVVWQAGRIVDDVDPAGPFELDHDGDLLALVREMVACRARCYS